MDPDDELGGGVMKRALWVAVGVGAATLGGVLLYHRPGLVPGEGGSEGEGEREVLPAGLPLRGVDLERLVATELAAKIPGLARFLAVVGAGESNWKIANPWGARNESASEVAASQAAFDALAKQGISLKPAAAKWGSGGAFGLLAPYALIAGRPDRPFLAFEPDRILEPVVSCAAAAAMVVRLRQSGITSWQAMRVAWKGLAVAKKDPELTGPTAQAVLARMSDDVTKGGLDALLPLTGAVDTANFPAFDRFLDTLKERVG